MFFNLFSNFENLFCLDGIFETILSWAVTLRF